MAGITSIIMMIILGIILPAIASILYDQHGHFTEYALLGLMIRFCIESWTGTRKWSIPLAWISGTLYAVTDEIHQLMISGRSGQWTDVAIDSCGAALGAAAAALIINLISRRAERHSGKEA